MTSEQVITTDGKSFITPEILNQNGIYWLVAEKLLGAPIPKSLFIPVKIINNIGYIYGNYDFNYSWSLFRSSSLITPNLIDIFNHKNNSENYKMNNFIYQSPFLLLGLSSDHSGGNTSPIRNLIEHSF